MAGNLSVTPPPPNSIKSNTTHKKKEQKDKSLKSDSNSKKQSKQDGAKVTIRSTQVDIRLSDDDYSTESAMNSHVTTRPCCQHNRFKINEPNLLLPRLQRRMRLRKVHCCVQPPPRLWLLRSRRCDPRLRHDKLDQEPSQYFRVVGVETEQD